MSLYTYTYNLYHIFLLGLLLTHSFQDERTLHNFLFLAKAGAGSLKTRFIYDFYKCRQGVYSFEADSHLRDLRKSDFLDHSLAPLKGGQEFYGQVATLLKYELFPDYCMRMINRYEGQLWRINHEVFFHHSYRKTRLGRKIEL